MRIRIFRAETVAAAMRQVRDELGLDALILTTESRPGLVEVTAALDSDEAPIEEPVAEPEFEPGFEPDRVPDLDWALSAGTTAPAMLDWLDEAPLPPARPDDAGLLSRHGLPPGLHEALRHGPLDSACSRLFRFSRLPIDADGAPLMLVGPPGAGKTLTVAKLATRLVLDGHRPLVITADEQRAGGVEQLAAFTRLLGLTLIAASRPDTLRRALARREPMSPVLIDMPGLDPFDPAEATLQAELAAAAGASVALILPAGLDPIEAAEIAEAQAALGARHLVPTRIERAARLGGILSASHAGGLALTEAGVGTDVAQGLARLTPAVLASWLAATPARRHPDVAAAPAVPAPPSRPPTPQQASPPVQDGRNALSLHIAAQAGSNRLPAWSTTP